MTSSDSPITNLAAFRKFVARLPKSWSEFQRQRQLRLVQQARNGSAAEKVAENIVEDFLTVALDWALCDLNNQLQYADIVLTRQGIKRLLIEVKRPGSLKWDRPLLEQALSQARRYADEQRVRTIAVTDGVLFYAADLQNGGLQDRARLSLDAPAYSPDAWWLSVDGVYRPATPLTDSQLGNDHSDTGAASENGSILPEPQDTLLHPKYNVPAECFAYVGDASKCATWKLPYRLQNGTVDERHLAGAIRAVLSNYRGTHVKTIPESAMPDVLVRLGKAAAEIHKLPGQIPSPSTSYQQLYDALYQLQKLDDVMPPTNAWGSGPTVA